MKLQLIRIWLLIMVIGMVPALVNAATLFGDDEMIWKGGPYTYIKLESQDSPEMGPNEHPVRLDSKSILHVLQQLRMDEGDKREIFTPDQAQTLADGLAKSLFSADPNQDVVFALQRSEESGLAGMKPDFFLMSGRAFYRLKQLHLIIGDYDRRRDLGFEAAYDPTHVGAVKYNLNQGKRNKASNAINAPIESYDGVKNMRYKGEVRNDWIVVDLDRALVAHEQKAAVERQQALIQKRKEILEALGEDAALIAPRAAPAPVPVQQPRTLEDRLMTLNKLKEKGLITDEEYAAKRQKILDSL